MVFPIAKNKTIFLFRGWLKTIFPESLGPISAPSIQKSYLEKN